MSARLKWRFRDLTFFVLIAVFFRVLFSPLLVSLFPSLKILLNEIPYSSFFIDPADPVGDLVTWVCGVAFLFELLTGRIVDLVVRAWKAIERRLIEASDVGDPLKAHVSALTGRLDDISTELEELRHWAALLKHVSVVDTRNRR